MPGKTDNNAPYDLIIIGAGPSGIVTARFYLDTHPTSNLVILESDNCVGGVWSRERVYEGFKAQGSTRTSGFSDVPFEVPAEGVDAWDFFDAHYMSDYLENYVDSHIYHGKTIRDRIAFKTTVERMDKVDGLWNVHCRGISSSSSGSVYVAPKVIVASGRTSTPNEPRLPGRESFKGKIVHTMDYGRSKILEQPEIKTVSVLGGGKSAADMAYQAVKAGKSVNWVIRLSGKGPGKFIDRKGKGPGRNIVELAHIRTLAAALNVSALTPQGLWSWFIGRTWIGRRLLSSVFNGISQKAAQDAGYDNRPGARESFKLLKNDTSALWPLEPAGICHYDDFWDTIAPNVDVYRADIERVTENAIHFTDGRSVETDAILCGTGFLDSFPFLSQSQCVKLGLPHDPDADTPEETLKWKELEHEAEKDVLKRCPLLASAPSLDPEKLGDIGDSTPYRLYNGIVPIDDPSILFIACYVAGNMFAISEAQAVWATAFLDDHIRLPDRDTMSREIAYSSAYVRLRCPTYGRLGNFFLFDFFYYLDKLMGEAGLSSYRKPSWRGRLFEPLFMTDFRDLNEEYRRKYSVESVEK